MNHGQAAKILMEENSNECDVEKAMIEDITPSNYCDTC